MTSLHDRAVCPDCGKDVAVKADGTLRKHQCVEPVNDDSPEVPEPDVTSDTVEPEIEPEASPEPEPAPEPAPVHHRALCVVPGCDRLILARGLCGAHFASRRGG